VVKQSDHDPDRSRPDFAALSARRRLSSQDGHVVESMSQAIPALPFNQPRRAPCIAIDGRGPVFCSSRAMRERAERSSKL